MGEVFRLPAASLAGVVEHGTFGPLALAGGRGGRSVIVGEVSVSSLLPGALFVETEHGVVLVPLDEEVAVVGVG